MEEHPRLRYTGVVRSERDPRSRFGAFMAALAVTVALSGCHSASIQSTRDPSFSGRMNRLFVILNHGQLEQMDAGYTPALIRALQGEFAKTRTTVTIRAIDALALSDPNYTRALAQYQPDGVLTMKMSGGVRGEYGGGLESIYYDLSLFSVQTRDKRVWRGQLQATGGTGVIEGKMNSAAEKLVQTLLKDRVIQ
jgi:hypothetical protein